MGPDASWLASLQPQIEELAARWNLPGLAVAAQRWGEPVARLAFGADAAGAPLSSETLFAVASVTKLATALALLRLVAQGHANLDAPLAEVLPDAALAQPGVTWRRLLSHTAGAPIDLAAGLAPYAPGLDWETLKRATLATGPLGAPGKQVVYSQLGTGLAAVHVERVTGLPFSQALDELVFAPLGITATLGDPGGAQTAAVGGVLGAQAGTPLEAFNRPFWRSLAMPWAGLFVSASGALLLARAFDPAQGDAFLPRALRAEAVSDQAHGLAGGFTGWMEWAPCPWGLGPELRGRKRNHFAGARASARSWGHLGASGCLAWCDPDTGIAWSLCAPRTAAPWLDGMAALSDLLNS